MTSRSMTLDGSSTSRVFLRWINVSAAERPDFLHVLRVLSWHVLPIQDERLGRLRIGDAWAYGSEILVFPIWDMIAGGLC